MEMEEKPVPAVPLLALYVVPDDLAIMRMMVAWVLTHIFQNLTTAHMKKI
jgi:hypothetical protein